MAGDRAPTPQEALWRGDFGDDYVARNEATEDNLTAHVQSWARMLRATEGAPPRRILEIGCNIGLNLRALRRLIPAELHAVEPNANARARLLKDDVLPAANLTDGVAASTGLETGSYDLVFTSGVLIHIHPDGLEPAIREMHRLSGRYLLCSEYFADRPQEVPYRGHSQALFKRDFGGLFLDLFPDLIVRDYGFMWKRTTGLDNPTWWLFEKG